MLFIAAQRLASNSARRKARQEHPFSQVPQGQICVGPARSDPHPFQGYIQSFIPYYLVLSRYGCQDHSMSIPARSCSLGSSPSQHAPTLHSRTSSLLPPSLLPVFPQLSSQAPFLHLQSQSPALPTSPTPASHSTPYPLPTLRSLFGRRRLGPRVPLPIPEGIEQN